MDKIEFEQIQKEKEELVLMLDQLEQIVSKLKAHSNHIEALKVIKEAEADAITILRHYTGHLTLSVKSFRPDDIKNFTAGISGTSKTMWENDTTVATGTTENTLSVDISNNEIYIITGIYLPKSDNIHTDYVSMYIGDSKQRWYRGSEIECTDNLGVSFRDPLIIKPGETIRIKFLTTSDGLGTGKANDKHQISILGKVFKSHETPKQKEVIITEEIDKINDKTESILCKIKKAICTSSS